MMKTSLNFNNYHQFFFLTLLMLVNNYCFAYELTWQGYNKAWFSLDPYCYLDIEYCWLPSRFKGAAPEEEYEAKFSDVKDQFTKISNSEEFGKDTKFGSFLFDGQKQYAITIYDSNTLSFYKEGITNKSVRDQKININKNSAVNFFNQSSADKSFSSKMHYDLKEKSALKFHDSSLAGNSIIDAWESEIAFLDQSSGENAKVKLSNQSILTIHSDNTLGHLICDSSSTINLNESSLSLGKENLEDMIKAKLTGKEAAKLIKEGSGQLILDSDARDFKGKLIVNEGTLIVDSHYLGNSNFEVKGSHSTCEFHSGAKIGASHLSIDQGRVFFKNDSSADSAVIEAKKGDITFSDSSKGHKAAISLSDHSKFSISQDNTIGSINLDETSKIMLDTHALSIGSLGKEDQIHGEMVGKKAAKIIKVGNGLLHIKGNHSAFEGSTVIDEGKIIFNGEIGSDIIVNDSAQFSGTGKIKKDLTIDTEGKIDLNVHDVLHVGGKYIQKEKGIYKVAIDKQGKSSKIKVDESAAIDKAIIKLDENPDPKLFFPYEILTAKEGIEGMFEIPQIFLKNKKVTFADSDKNKVVMKFVPQFKTENMNENQQIIVQQIDKLKDPKEEIYVPIDNLVLLNDKELYNALDDLSGLQYTHFILATERSTDQFIRRIYTPLRFISIDCDCPELSYNRCLIWGDFEGGKSYQNGKCGYHTDDFNVTVAIQRSVNDWLTENCPLTDVVSCSFLTGWTTGFAASYTHQKFHFELGGDSDLNDVKGAFYALLTKSKFYFLADFILGYSTGKLERPIEFAMIKHKAHGDLNLFNATFYGELGLNNIYCYDFGIQPYGAIETGYYRLSDIKEHGSGGCFELEINSKNQNLTTSYLGLHIHSNIDGICSWGFAADLAWKHLFNFDNNLTEEFIHFHNDDKFDISGCKTDLDGIVGSLTFFKEINDCWSISAELSGEKWSSYSNFYLSAGVILNW